MSGMCEGGAAQMGATVNKIGKPKKKRLYHFFQMKELMPSNSCHVCQLVVKPIGAERIGHFIIR